MVSNHGSQAFSAMQSFTWRVQMDLSEEKTHRLGFREMQNLRMLFHLVSPCRCVKALSDVSDSLRWLDHIAQTETNSYYRVYPRDLMENDISILYSLPERVLGQRRDPNSLDEGKFTDVPTPVRRIWYFYVSENPSARWLQMAFLRQLTLGLEEHFSYILRNKDCCIKCATNLSHIRVDPTKISLILL